MPKVLPGYKAEARKRILETARELFVLRGYRRTTMDDVAERVGVSKGTLYLYYRSKVDLLRDIQATNRALSRQWMDEALARSESPVDRFTDTFEDVFRRAIGREEVALFFEVLGEASHDAEIRAALRVDHREDLRSLQRFLRELRRRGQLAPDADLEVLAFMIVGLFQAAVWDLSLGIDPTRTRRVLRAALNQMLAPPEPPASRGPRRARAPR